MSDYQFRVVLIEDNPGDIYLFQQALQAAGVQVALTLIEDGGEAMAFARKQRQYSATLNPDLIVLDLNLPKNPGTEVLEVLRSNPETSGIPVAIMTSSAAPQELSAVKDLGIELFITKPADLDEFLKIGDVLKQILMEPGKRKHSLGS